MNNTNNTITIFGIASFLGFCKTQKDPIEKYRVTIDALDTTDLSQFDRVYANANPRYVPDWYSKKTLKMSFKSLYDIPCIIYCDDGTKSTMYLSELKNRNDLCGSKIGIELNPKDGAIYPKAIAIYSFGEPHNPFENLENIDLPFN